MTAEQSWRASVVSVAVLAVCASACGNSAPLVAPTPRVSPTEMGPTAPATPGWTVTIETRAVTGPDFCIWTPPLGSVFRGEYTVVRTGGSVSFIPPDPIDWDSFTAMLNGADFEGTNPPMEFGRGMCAHYWQSSRLTGTFAADNGSFTAAEVLSYLLDTGGVRAITFSWSGTRH